MTGTKVAVFHPGTQHSWQTARALQQLGRLEWFASSILYNPDAFPYYLDRLPGPLGRKLAYEFRRFEPRGLDPALTRSAGAAEWFERIAARSGMPRLAAALDAWGNRRFGSVLAKEIGSPAPFALWGFNGGARSSFELGKRRGRACILDRTIGHSLAHNAVMGEVRENWPAWFGAGNHAFPQSVIIDEEAEFELADAIVVGSETAAETIRSQSKLTDIDTKLTVLPYCYDEALFALSPAPTPVSRTEPVRFLMVGQLGPRKGIHLLLEAIARLPATDATLTLVGGFSVPPRTLARFADRFTHVRHVPRSAIPAIMSAHHVLVFPSYFEGSALSLLEALASGLALIQSPQAGMGVTPACGLSLGELTVDALVDAMRVPIRDRERLDAWRTNARLEARNYTFTRYRDRISELLSSMRI